MLLRFSVENFLSFHKEATFSMVASSDDRHPDHVVRAKSRNKPPVLRGAAIYGANGHGKSNFVTALRALKRMVSGGPVPGQVFKLDPASAKNPTRFVIEFRHNDVDYEYGLVRNKEFILEEWLFLTRNRGGEKRSFERVTKKTKGEYFTKVQLGAALADQPSPSSKVDIESYIEVLATGLDPNVTFLEEAHSKKVSALDDAYDWFENILTPVSADARYINLHERAGTEKKFKKAIERFVCSADTGIEDIELIETPLEAVPQEDLPKDILDGIADLDEDHQIEVGTNDGRSYVITKNAKGKLVKKELVAHRLSSNGELVAFSADEESSGTRRLMELAPMLADEDDDRVYVVDELDRKLHPLLAYQLVESFLRRGAGQLIFTTHNTHLMSLKLLRRDEIFFVQKDAPGHSEIYSLHDLKVRPDLDVKKGYLHGRFGAIPFLGNVADLGWSEA